MYDVVIIGSGISGASTARVLSRYKLKTAVLEKGSDVCSGASRGNSAMVHGGYDAEPGSLKAKYNVLGNRMFDSLCTELQVPFERSGTAVLATDADGMTEINKLHEQGIINGVKTVIFTGNALKRRWPNIGDGVKGALFCESGGMVCPYTLVIAMCENAVINGTDFYLNCEVDLIEKRNGVWYVHCADGRKFESRIVINCAGTCADKINNMVSAETFSILPRYGGHLVMDRDYIKYVDTTMAQTPEKLKTGGHTKGMAIMPSVDGTVLLGCDAEDHMDPDDTQTTAESNAKLLEFFSKFWPNLPIAKAFPEFPAEGIINAYGGLRPHCDRNDFIIGEASDAPGFFNAAGIESPGLTAGPAIGEELGRMIAERLGAELKENYIPGRHVAPVFRTMSYEERAAAIKDNPDYAKMVCRCEQVTEAEIRDAIRRPLGARTVNAVKMRTRAGMGRCQGGFCQSKVLEILCEELGLDPLDVTLAGEGSSILAGRIGEAILPETDEYRKVML